MDTNRAQTQAPSFGWLKSLVIFLVGLLIGLVVLGWWLWPVEWVNATPEQLTTAWHQEYLRMAIDSYTVNQDAGLAQMRYDALGPYAQSTLNSVAQNPGTVPPAEIDSYANVVQPGGLAAVSGATAPVTAPTRNIALIVIFAALFVLLLVFAVIVYLISRSRRSRSDVYAAPGQSSGMVLEPASPVSEETAAMDQSLETTEPSQVEMENVGEDVTLPAETETSTVDDMAEEGASRAGIAAAGVAAAGAAAAFWDDESQTEEEATTLAEAGAVAGLEEGITGTGQDAAGAEATVDGTAEDTAAGDLFKADSRETIAVEPSTNGAAAAMAAAGLVAAAVHQGGEEVAEPEESNIEQVLEPAANSEEEISVAQAEEPGFMPELDGGNLAPLAAGGLAAAAFMDSPAQVDEELEPAAAFEEQPPLETEANIAAVEAEPEIAPRPKQLDYIEGVGNVYTKKLGDAGITTAEALLEKGSTPKGRKEIAESSGISEKLILRWVNMVDLYRIKGIGQEYADLLEAAGVDTVPELAQRVPENLLERMIAVNEQKKLVRHLPVLSQVTSWVEQAKQLPRVIHY